MASREPLLHTDTEPVPRTRFPYLAFFRQWTKGQPLRETESLDYEPLYNKVYFARRKQPSRRFYGYAGLHIKKHMTAYCTHGKPASSSTGVDAHNRFYQLLWHPTVHCVCRYTGHTLAKFFVTLATGLVTGLTAAACAATLEFVFRRKQMAVQWIIDIVKHKALLAGFGLHLLITTSLLMFAACLVSILTLPICCLTP